MSNNTHIGFISKAGLRSLRAGNSPTIHANHSSNFDTPIYLGSRVDLRNSENELNAAYQKGREDMRSEFISMVEMIKGGAA